MNHPPPYNETVRVRNEMLVALKLIYPAALQADHLFRSLLAVFPTLEWQCFKRHLCYLTEKKYLQRIVADTESHQTLTPWRKRWFRITARGTEIADHLINDPAMPS